MCDMAGLITQPRIKGDMKVAELVQLFSGCAFGAGRLSRAVEILGEMVSDEGCRKFLGLAGAMVPGGMRNIVSQLIQEGWVDVLVTTGANLVHDMLEALDLHHYRGSSSVDDLELRRLEINRIYDVYLPERHFTVLEEKLQTIFRNLDGGRTYSIRELLAEIGESLDDRNSILRSAVDAGVPVFCPAVQDSIIGLQAWLYRQQHKLKVDTFQDLHEFIDLCYESKKTGALLIGGGVPKNFILQSMLVTPRGFDYAVQLTTDTPQWGGLSGATLDEAISWGKLNENAKSVTVYCDATISLPLIVASLLGKRKQKA